MQRPQGGVWGIAVGCEVAMKGVWFTRDVDRSIGKLGRAGRGEHAHALLFSDSFVAKEQGFKPYRFIFTTGGEGAIKMVDLQATPPGSKPACRNAKPLPRRRSCSGMLIASKTIIAHGFAVLHSKD